MKYMIENDGIHLIVETEFDADYPAVKPDIPLAEAVNECHKIRDRIDAALDDMKGNYCNAKGIIQLADGEDCVSVIRKLRGHECECEQQGAPTKCGACDG